MGVESLNQEADRLQRIAELTHVGFGANHVDGGGN
jgi:hypothetical protein